MNIINLIQIKKKEIKAIINMDIIMDIMQNIFIIKQSALLPPTVSDTLAVLQ